MVLQKVAAVEVNVVVDEERLSLESRHRRFALSRLRSTARILMITILKEPHMEFAPYRFPQIAVSIRGSGNFRSPYPARTHNVDAN